jgi:hypothetical protein
MLRCAIAAAAILIAVAPTGALAAPAATTSATHRAALRGAHLSPDTAGVDVYLTSFAGGTTTLWLSSVGYGDVSGYRMLKPGLYAVSMRAHGASPSDPPALRWTAQLRAGDAYTAAAVGMNKDLHGIVLRDDLSSPRVGTSRVRVIQAASRAQHADIYANGDTLAHDVPFSAVTKYSTVPAGDWRVRAAAVGDEQVSAQTGVAVPSGQVVSIVVLDAKSRGITLRKLVDAAGASSVPNGAVPAGGGGTATRPAADDLSVGLAAAVLAILGTIGVAVSKRRGRELV